MNLLYCKKVSTMFHSVLVYSTFLYILLEITAKRKGEYCRRCKSEKMPIPSYFVKEDRTPNLLNCLLLYCQPVIFLFPTRFSWNSWICKKNPLWFRFRTWLRCDHINKCNFPNNRLLLTVSSQNEMPCFHCSSSTYR